MNEMDHKLKEYESTINVIVAKYDDFYKEDIKQELFEFLYDCILNNRFKNARDEKNYVFICLKNQALAIYRNKYRNKVKMVSFDDENTTGIKLENIVSNDWDEGEKTKFIKGFSLGELESKICQICNVDEYKFLCKCFEDNITQSEIANELGISQQKDKCKNRLAKINIHVVLI